MDVVITYVDSNDSVWKQDYQKYTNVPVMEKRFRDWGTLKYLLRGIEKHMPFVENVFLVVSHPSQVPAWVDKTRVKVVLHSEFIPEELLPTFNSIPIEIYLHRIEDLGEEYIYFNDDLFPVKDSKAEDFYREGKGVLGFSRHLLPFGMFKRLCRNSDKAARRALSMPSSPCFLRPQHSCQPMFKSAGAEVYKLLEDDIRGSMTRTRTSGNICHYVYMDYAYYTGRMISERISCKHFSAAVTSPARLTNFIENPYRSFMCLNDVKLGEEKFVEMQSAVINAFEKKFPQKSRFEL